MAISNEQARDLFIQYFPFLFHQSVRLSDNSVTDPIVEIIQIRLHKILQWDQGTIEKIARLFHIYFENKKMHLGEPEGSSLTINFENLTQKGRLFYCDIPFSHYYWAIVESEYITFHLDELKNGWRTFELSTSKLTVFAGNSVKYYRFHGRFEKSKTVKDLQSDVYKIRKTMQMYYPNNSSAQTSGEEVQRWGILNLDDLFPGIDEGGVVIKCRFFNSLKESTGKEMIRLNSVDLPQNGNCLLSNKESKKYSTLKRNCP